MAEQRQANVTVQDPESGLGTQDIDSNILPINGGADSNNIAQSSQLPQVEDIGPDNDAPNDLKEDDNCVLSRQAYLNNSLNMTTDNDANIPDTDNGTIGTNNNNAHTTSTAQPSTVQQPSQAKIAPSVRPKTYASVVKTPSQTNPAPSQTNPAPSQPTVSNQPKRQRLINNKFNKFRNITGNMPFNLHNFQWSNKKTTPEFHLNMLSKKLSTLNFSE
ncbi:unnamed protein product [Rotaria socialis]|uniref:Uncharacterized protein n=1 Tax=Rotaria socialis TaxID=392032 RepID=A0A821UL10_9BILA|nr:unnamed protein product [Rotaria socialis]